ncbi:MAG: PepSY domain-containing protein [Pseudomonadota bacterium]
MTKPGISLLGAFAILAIAGTPAVSAQAAYAQSKDDQSDARKEMRAGNQLSLRQIEARVLPRMRGSEYLGPSYDSTARAYRLKFIKDGRVTFVDVDARTGRIINRSR